MRKFILSSLELISNIAIFLMLVSGVISGGTGGGIGGGAFGALLGALLGFLGALVAAVILFGIVFLLMEIADNTRRMAEAAERP